MIRAAARLSPLLLLAALPACSPAYAFKSARGHMSLLWSRRPIDKVLSDPRAEAAVKEKLRLVQEARAFGFETLGLSRTRDYSTYAPVAGEALTWLVSASPKLMLESHRWSFPFVGTFPYKGYFDKADAEAEAKALEARGLDAHVGGASAYNTPLWVSDPVPQTMLRHSTGTLSALILHELAHGTVFYKDRMEFNEAFATFVGEQGAKEFLAKRFGADSAELKAYLKRLDKEKELAAAFEKLYEELGAVYSSSSTDQSKLDRRAVVFKDYEKRLEAMGWDLGPLNNAAVLAHRVYRGEVDTFRRAFESVGGDWRKFFELARSLNRKDPAADLRNRPQSGARL